VRLTVGAAVLELRPYRVAHLLDLPRRGRSDLRIGGARADAFFARLSKSVGREPRDAEFVPVANGIRLRPSRDGRAVDVPATAAGVLRAALSPSRRVARLVAESTQPKLTTAEAKKLG